MSSLLKKLVSIIILLTVTCYVLPIYAFTNTETIYSKLDNSGKAYKETVSTKENDEVKEENTDKQLPIETEITYKLNGQEISAEEVVGKSGKITINIKCINKMKQNVIVNGRNINMYVPFIVTLGTVINSEYNSNVEISKNGKVIENENDIIVAGLVLPGLKESMNLKGELSSIDIPNSIEIKLDSTNFELVNIMMFSTPNLITEDIDWSKVNDLFNDMNELQNGINTIEEGSQKLSDGAKELNDGANTLNNGTNTLKDGAKTLSDGINSLESGAKTLGNGMNSLSSGISQVNSGANALNSGVDSLKEGSKALEDGANQLNSSYTELDNGIQSIANGAPVLSDAITKIQSGFTDLKAGASGVAVGITNVKNNLSQLASGASSLNTTATTLASQAGSLPLSKVETVSGTATVDNSGVSSNIDNAKAINNEAIGVLQGALAGADETTQAIINDAIGKINSSNGSLDAAKSSMVNEVSISNKSGFIRVCCRIKWY